MSTEGPHLMLLTFMRHGEPVRGAEGAERLDPGLAQAGVAQAERSVVLLERTHCDAVYSSPLRRARETATIVGAGLGHSVAVDEDLAEFDRGAEYLHYEDGGSVWASYLQGDLSPWGTTMQEFGQRVRGAVDRLVARHGGQHVVAVCHGGVINRFGCEIFGLEHRVQLFAPDYGSLSSFSLEGGVWRVVSLNDRPPPWVLATGDARQMDTSVVE